MEIGGGSGSSRELDFEVLPYLEVTTAPGTARFYGRALLRVTGRWTTNEELDRDAALRANRFTVGAGVGAHFFVTPHLSLSPGLELLYLRGRGSRPFRDVRTGEVQDVDEDVEGFRFRFFVAFQAWFGGDVRYAPPSGAGERGTDEAAASRQGRQPTPGEDPLVDARMAPPPAAPLVYVPPRVPGTTLRREVPLEGGTLVLVAAPERNAGLVGAQYATSAPEARFERCREMAVVAGGRRAELRNVEHETEPFAGGVGEVLLGTGAVDDREAVAATSGSKLALCSVEVSLSSSARYAIRLFLRELRERGVRDTFAEPDASDDGGGDDVGE